MEELQFQYKELSQKHNHLLNRVINFFGLFNYQSIILI